MKRALSEAFARCGMSVSVLHGGETAETKAFLQLVKRENGEEPFSVTALGAVDEQCWRYLGPADVAVAMGDFVQCGERRYVVRAAGPFYVGEEIDQLVRGGVTPVETVGGVSSPVRGITTKTSSGGAADTTWRELTTILIVDEVIPTIRSALRTRFARSKNTAQSRGAIRSQVVLELEEMKSREIVDSYGEVLVSALKSDPTVCLVEFSFTVAHGLNRIYLTAHITV